MFQHKKIVSSVKKMLAILNYRPMVIRGPYKQNNLHKLNFLGNALSMLMVKIPLLTTRIEVENRKLF